MSICDDCDSKLGHRNTLPSLKLTAKAPKNHGLEDEFPFGIPYSQRQCMLVPGGYCIFLGEKSCR